MATLFDISRIESLRGEDLPVYAHYSREFEPQPAYIAMSADGTIWAEAQAWVGSGLPEEQAHNRVITWDINPALTGAEIAAFVAEHLSLFERVHAGHSVEYDRNANLVGTLDEDAQAASDQLDALAEALEPTLSIWAAEDWFQHSSAEDLGVDAGTDDTKLAEIADELDDAARDENNVIDGTLEYLRGVRDDLRAAA